MGQSSTWQGELWRDIQSKWYPLNLVLNIEKHFKWNWGWLWAFWDGMAYGGRRTTKTKWRLWQLRTRQTKSDPFCRPQCIIENDFLYGNLLICPKNIINLLLKPNAKQVLAYRERPPDKWSKDRPEWVEFVKNKFGRSQKSTAKPEDKA
jgi:hypothetical protein